jgi:hypothetical protein
MAHYLLLLYDDPSRWQKLGPPQFQQALAKYMSWGQKAEQAGFLVGSNKLADDAGKVIRGAQALVTDGPYSETKEVLAGYYLIDASNYDEAVRRSLDHPHLEYGGTIEVRLVEVIPS